MPLKQIYLDVDGVLCDFVGAVAQLLGRDLGALLSGYTPGNYEMHEELGISADEMWCAIDRGGHEFWAGIPEYPWRECLHDLCLQYAPTVLLTKPGFDPSAASGKAAWIRRHFGARYKDFLIGMACKSHCARPDAVLIDDSDHNCAAFRAAGGEAILFPRVWNANHPHKDQAVEYVAGELARLSTSPGRSELERHRSRLDGSCIGVVAGPVPDESVSHQASRCTVNMEAFLRPEPGVVSPEPLGNGINLKDSGARAEFAGGAVRDLQAGKGRFDLLSHCYYALRGVAQVYEAGELKYPDGVDGWQNWEKGMPTHVLANSALHHLLRYIAGFRDEPHLFQSLWNMLGLAEVEGRIVEGRLPVALATLPRPLAGVEPIPADKWRTVLDGSWYEDARKSGLPA